MNFRVYGQGTDKEITSEKEWIIDPDGGDLRCIDKASSVMPIAMEGVE